MKLQSSAIWMAVLCLSPVNIQKFIPERLSVSIVLGTPLYSKNKVKRKVHHRKGQVQMPHKNPEIYLEIKS